MSNIISFFDKQRMEIEANRKYKESICKNCLGCNRLEGYIELKVTSCDSFRRAY